MSFIMKMIFLISILFLPKYTYSLTLPMKLQLHQEDVVQKFPIVNSDIIDHDYQLSVREVTFPDRNMEVINQNDEDIWLSEWIFSLSSGSKKELGISYHGEPSRVERYFLIDVKEMKENSLTTNQIGRHINTILILSPLEPLLNFNIVDGQLENHSNASFLFMEDFDCGASMGLTRIIPPGKSIKLPIQSDNAIHSIGFNDTIRVIYNGCLENKD